MRSLLLIIFTSFFSNFVAISYASTLNGALVHDLIVEKLNSHNLNAQPAIDMARKFPSCPSQISIKSIFGSWKTVQVSCPETNWKIAVRTNIMQTKFTLSENAKGDKKSPKSYIALRTSLNKGEVIKKNHLKYYASKKNIGGGVFYEKNHLIGRTLKRALSVGTIIRARHLNPNWVIEKGQLVTIEHKVGTIIIKAQGVAQEPGQFGQRIWVNNFNSGKKVLCWVQNDKKVTTNAKVY